MPIIHTSSGPIDANDLGFVLTHEHVMICSPEVRAVWPESLDIAAAEQRCIARLAAARAAGVDTLVDVTTIDFGRDATFIEHVARAADLRVVVSTGVWNVPIYFQFQPLESAEAFFVKEITRGIEGSDLKAALIKITTNGPTLTPAEDKVFRAAARAHRRTGVPITTHTEASTRGGLDQQRVLADEGVDLSRVVIGHSETLDFSYLQQLLDRGSFVSVDRFGSDSESAARMGRPTHAQRLEIVARLCRDGYASQLLLSHDTAGISVFPVDWYDQTYPNARFDYIARDVLPQLLEAGVTHAQIEQMTRDNARRLFSQQTPY
ncbi:MAG TPA: phosphotriesterase-related protein [Chloroflexota bacterium]